MSAADDVFAAGAPSRRIQRPADGTTTRVGSTGVEVPGSDEAPDVTHLTHSAKSSKEPGVSRDDFSEGRRGRTMTGIAAAAITTVLTVVVAGQVATGEDDSRGSVAGGSDRSGEDPASRSEGRKAPAEPKPDKPAPKTYHQKMSGLFEMDPKMDGTGEFTTISGGNEGAGAGTRLRYRVDVEKELGLDGELFARAVHTTLNDDRSWAHGGQREFERVSSGRVDFVITLASPGTTAVWCAKSGLDTTEDNVSCDSAATDRIMINGYRWARGSETFGDSRILAYRQMLINHEVGHRLGFNHVGCDKEGALAPVMMQQTKHLDSDGRVCRPNAWLHPDA